MTDYNDGKWHAWNGGECPVHPASEVQVRLCDPREEHGIMIDLAGGWDWPYRGSSAIVSFRVTKPYVEPNNPREWWIGTTSFSGLPDIQVEPKEGYIHVREVLE